jgi:hypothetical protein
MSSTKRQQTMAKRNRERAVEEKRTLKRLKKQAAKAEKAAGGPVAWETAVEEEPVAEEPVAGEPVAEERSEAEPDVE